MSRVIVKSFLPVIALTGFLLTTGIFTESVPVFAKNNSNNGNNSTNTNPNTQTKTQSIAVPNQFGTFDISGVSAPSFAFELNINPQYGTTNGQGTGATAKITFAFTQLGNDVILGIAVENTTDGTVAGGANSSNLVNFGFDLPEGVNITGYNPGIRQDGSEVYGAASSNQNLSGGSVGGTYDVGFGADQDLNGGKANGLGVNTDEAALVSFRLSGQNLTPATIGQQFLSGFQSGQLKAVGRFQQVGNNATGASSDKVGAGGVTAISTPEMLAEEVPEPATIAGIALGVSGLISARRRRVNLK